jgi:hypothetical protein
VAQIGSVIGRDFSYAIIRAVTDVEDAALQAALDQLTEADILLVQGMPPDSEYTIPRGPIEAQLRRGQR